MSTFLWSVFLVSSLAAATYDVVIQNGRVVDPESGLDAVRNVGISGGSIRAVSRSALSGRTKIDARGLVVAPGFIDLHAHGVDIENSTFQVMDGVTTALELEIGTADVDGFYAEREGRRHNNYGVSIGHVRVRMAVMHDPSEALLPTGDAAQRAATPAEIEEMKKRIDDGLRRGAPAVGMGLQYTPAAAEWEALEMFRVAARHAAPVHVHMRHAGEKEPGGIQALQEVLADAAMTGAPLHVVHVSSMGLGATPRLLEMIRDARARGLDVTTECYPYTAGMTAIESALFEPGWQQIFGIDYDDLQWTATGERLTAETFARYRKQGGMVVMHTMPEALVESAVASPLTMIASDGLLANGKGHPRTSGTYSRVLGRYVREKKTLTLMDALRKMTLMPAERLEHRVPAMKNKGRIRAGADADITIFDPASVLDQSTYQSPAKFSRGIRYVLVNGVVVVREGELDARALPGKAIRAPIK